MTLATTQNENIVFSGELSLPMAEQSVSMKSEFTLNIAKGALDITTIDVGIGDQTHIKTQLQANQLYTAPAFEIGAVDLQLDFSSVQPFMDILEIPIQAWKTWLYPTRTIASLAKKT